MVTIGNRDKQLSDLLIKLRAVRLGPRRRPAGDPRLAGLDLRAGRCRPPTWSPASGRSLTTDVKQLRTVAGNLDRNKAEIDRALQVLPIKLNKIGRTAIYGSFFNFYLCNFKGSGEAAPRARPSRSSPVDYATNSPRCDLG